MFLLFIEDVYLNGICCERIGVEVIYFLGFDIVRSRGKVNGWLFEKWIIGYYFFLKDIIFMWDEFKIVLKLFCFVNNNW